MVWSSLQTHGNLLPSIVVSSCQQCQPKHHLVLHLKRPFPWTLMAISAITSPLLWLLLLLWWPSQDVSPTDVHGKWWNKQGPTWSYENLPRKKKSRYWSCTKKNIDFSGFMFNFRSVLHLESLPLSMTRDLGNEQVPSHKGSWEDDIFTHGVC